MLCRHGCGRSAHLYYGWLHAGAWACCACAESKEGLLTLPRGDYYATSPKTPGLVKPGWDNITQNNQLAYLRDDGVQIICVLYKWYIRSPKITIGNSFDTPEEAMAFADQQIVRGKTL